MLSACIRPVEEHEGGLVSINHTFGFVKQTLDFHPIKARILDQFGPNKLCFILQRCVAAVSDAAGCSTLCLADPEVRSIGRRHVGVRNLLAASQPAPRSSQLPRHADTTHACTVR